MAENKDKEGIFDSSYEKIISDLQNKVEPENEPVFDKKYLQTTLKQIAENFSVQQKEIENLWFKNDELKKELTTIKMSIIMNNQLLSQLRIEKSKTSKVYDEAFERWYETNCEGYSDAEKDIAAAAWFAAIETNKLNGVQ